MANKRKYPEVKGWWVYSIYIPSINKYYIGVSKYKKCSQRWRKSAYLTTVLNQYLNEWDSMIKTVIQNNLTKEQSYQLEGELIQDLNKKDLCINERRSGLITNDMNAYIKEYRENNTEYQERQKEYDKQRYENNKEQFKEYNKQYYENNKEREKERCKQWKENNKEQWKEYQKEYQKQYYQNNPEYRERCKQQRRQRYLKEKIRKTTKTIIIIMSRKIDLYLYIQQHTKQPITSFDAIETKLNYIKKQSEIKKVDKLNRGTFTLWNKQIKQNGKEITLPFYSLNNLPKLLISNDKDIMSVLFNVGEFMNKTSIFCTVYFTDKTNENFRVKDKSLIKQ